MAPLKKPDLAFDTPQKDTDTLPATQRSDGSGSSTENEPPVLAPYNLRTTAARQHPVLRQDMSMMSVVNRARQLKDAKQPPRKTACKDSLPKVAAALTKVSRPCCVSVHADRTPVVKAAIMTAATLVNAAASCNATPLTPTQRQSQSPTYPEPNSGLTAEFIRRCVVQEVKERTEPLVTRLGELNVALKLEQEKRTAAEASAATMQKLIDELHIQVAASRSDVQDATSEATVATKEAASARADLRAFHLYHEAALADYGKEVAGLTQEVKALPAKLASKIEERGVEAEAAASAAAGAAQAACFQAKETAGKFERLLMEVAKIEATVAAYSCEVDGLLSNRDRAERHTTAPASHSPPMQQHPTPLAALGNHVETQAFMINTVAKDLLNLREDCIAHAAQQQGINSGLCHVRGELAKVVGSVTEMQIQQRAGRHTAGFSEPVASADDPEEPVLEGPRPNSRIPSAPTLSSRVAAIETSLAAADLPKLRHDVDRAVEVARLQEVTMSHLVRDARGTQQANKGCNLVMFGVAPSLDSDIAKLVGESRDVALHAHAVDLCVKVQTAVEHAEGKTSDIAQCRRHYERVIDCVTEFKSASAVGRGNEGQTAQRNLVVTFVGQNHKNSFITLNNRLRRAHEAPARQADGETTAGARGRPSVRPPLHVVHDLSPKERQAFKVLQAHRGQLLQQGKQASMGAYRGVATLVMLHCMLMP